jgi:hypothetical protein
MPFAEGPKSTKMKRSAFTACVFIPLLITSILASEDRDGNWWRTRRGFDKAVYVTGMIDGVYIGTAILTKNILTRGDSKGDSTAVDSLTAGAKRLLVGVKVGQLVDGMDRFYSDFRNRGIMAWAALYIVSMQISGATDEEIRTWTLMYRRASSEASAIHGD